MKRPPPPYRDSAPRTSHVTVHRPHGTVCTAFCRTRYAPLWRCSCNWRTSSLTTAFCRTSH
eukprot:3491691-Pleurochrysis_carterae.AAC.1